MIRAENVTKKFEDLTALSAVNCTIPDGCVYGMVGSNGAGKSTLLRLLAGVYRQDGGSVTLDGEPIWENPRAKARIAFVPDEFHFTPWWTTIRRLAASYSSLFPSFDKKRLFELCRSLGLDVNKSLGGFSKGMKRQTAALLALCIRPDYLFFDETFDGLDTAMRGYMKNLNSNEVMERGTAVLITSHSLRELEDTCDQLALLHKGGLVLESDVAGLKTKSFKIQIAFDGEFDESRFEGINVLRFTKRGSVADLIFRGDRSEVEARLKAMDPVILDVLPLSLEEVFTYEMEALGYSFNVN